MSLFHFSQERHGAKTIPEVKQFVTKLQYIQEAKKSLATRMFCYLFENVKINKFYSSLKQT